MGYDQSPGTQTGSHNLLLGGSGNSYTSYGGIVGGSSNKISGAYASILGGVANTASGYASTINSGDSNKTITAAEAGARDVLRARARARRLRCRTTLRESKPDEVHRPGKPWKQCSFGVFMQIKAVLSAFDCRKALVFQHLLLG
jgi:hypothetical protein